MMDYIEDITYDKLLDWFLNEFNNSVAAYDQEDAELCFEQWENVKSFLVQAKWRMNEDYNWTIFRTVIIDIETRTNEIKTYLNFKSLQTRID